MLPLRTRKATALLLFLLVQWCYYKRSSHRREFLADLLWPGLDGKAGLNNLRQSLFIVKEACLKEGIPPFLANTRHTVRIAENSLFWCDLHTLNSKYNSKGLVRLPAGLLKPLPNIVLFDAFPYQEWLEQLQADITKVTYNVFLQAIDQEIQNENWNTCEQLIQGHLSRTEPTIDLAEKMAIACAKQGKSLLADTWFAKAGISSKERQEKNRALQQVAVPQSPASTHVPAPQALEIYLSAWSTYNKATPITTNQSVELFKQAISIDPEFRRAHLGLATAISTQGSWWGDKKMKDIFFSFEEAVQAASHDPSLQPEIDAIMGFTKLWLWEIDEAEQHFRRSTIATSSTSFGWMGLAHTLNILGRHVEAKETAQLAINKDPYYVQSYICLAEAELLLGNPTRSEEICRLALAKHPDYQPGLSTWIWALIQLENYSKAIFLAEQSIQHTGLRNYFVIGRLAIAYFLNQQPEAAEKILLEMKSRALEREKGFPYYIALYYQVIGQSEKAVLFLEKYLADLNTDYLWLKVQPEFAPIRQHPRFQRLITMVFNG